MPSISLLGESALLVCFPDRISPGVNSQVHDLALTLRERALPGVLDLVPAYATLLVSFDADRATEVDLIEEIKNICAANARHADLPKGFSRLHLVPVQYGGEAGPDLDEVARMHGLTTEEVVRLHTGRDYRVYFLGFLPGFAYLGRLPSSLETPRLANPRTRVSAGSVGLAGLQTAVYPFASPGGWRLIGRTSLSVWDPMSDTPVRFAPGDRVRFVKSAHEPEVPDLQMSPMRAPAHPALEVLSADGLTTVQDLGRPGLAHIGLARGGVCDARSAVKANALVGNAPEAALLEMAWRGPTLRALRNLTIALAGSDLGCTVDGNAVPMDLSWFVRRGSTVKFMGPQSGHGGMRAYLAVSGGVDVPTVLGGRATMLAAHFGGYMGRPLQAGDIIGVCKDVADTVLLAGKFWPGKDPQFSPGQTTIRYVPFRGRGEAREAAQREFQRRSFELTEQADRMGYRFRSADGTSLPASERELISFGVVRGAIQVPPSGNPVVLNVEHQTTGGYPLLGSVAKVDFHLLAHIRPGSMVRFVPIEHHEARRAFSRSVAELSALLRAMGQALPD